MGRVSLSIRAARGARRSATGQQQSTNGFDSARETYLCRGCSCGSFGVGPAGSALGPVRETAIYRRLSASMALAQERRGFAGDMARASTGRGQKVLQVLAGRDQQSPNVRVHEALPLEPPSAMPLLRLGKERLRPHLPHAAPRRIRRRTCLRFPCRTDTMPFDLFLGEDTGVARQKAHRQRREYHQHEGVRSGSFIRQARGIGPDFGGQCPRPDRREQQCCCQLGDA